MARIVNHSITPVSRDQAFLNYCLAVELARKVAPNRIERVGVGENFRAFAIAHPDHIQLHFDGATDLYSGFNSLGLFKVVAALRFPTMDGWDEAQEDVGMLSLDEIEALEEPQGGWFYKAYVA